MGNTQSVARDVWVTRVVLDEYDVRGALVVGERRAVVFDTLSRPHDMRTFVPLIGDRELVVVYSHADWDHIWGTAGLPYQRARIVAHDLTRTRFDADVPATLTQKQAAEPGAWDDVVLVAPTVCFDREWSLDLGGMTLTLSHLPGHTPDCIVGFIPERGVLLGGDTVETPCPVVPPDAPLAAWIEELRRWAANERVRTVVPAHGTVGGREILKQTVEYLEGILNGCPIAPAGRLTDFYSATHLNNMRWHGAGS